MGCKILISKKIFRKGRYPVNPKSKMVWCESEVAGFPNALPDRLLSNEVTIMQSVDYPFLAIHVLTASTARDRSGMLGFSYIAGNSERA
jgi:hypothetical protein